MINMGKYNTGRYTIDEARDYLKQQFKREPTEEEVERYYKFMTSD